MKAFLMYQNQDFDSQRQLPSNEQALTQDLELKTLFNAMALGDEFLLEAAKKSILLGLDNDLDTIRYRQDILKDCLRNPAIVRDIYTIAVEAIENKKRGWYGLFTHSPSGILYSAVQTLKMFIGYLKKIKKIADECAHKFDSDGFKRFFAMIKKELDDEYFAVVQNHLKTLEFHNGALISASLGKGNEGTDYVLRKPHEKDENWVKRAFNRKSPTYTFHIHPRDDHGARAASELNDRGINLVANALAQSADHINSFFEMLRLELAFYVGCLNLSDQLAQMGEPICFPQVVDSNQRKHSFKGLYDICLALTVKQKIVGNEIDADNKDLVVITGANQGGKSTTLRSLGLAQLMMQAGMFAPAESFCANACTGLFTHYKRKEDASMKSGKLDEELGRMSEIIDKITPNSMILFNESFAATNEREGSEIARQIVSALLEKRIKVFFVTHQYEFARGFYAKNLENAIFLRAERKAGGARTFKLIEGEPLQTSYGEDLYRKIFG
ncbi:MAG: DNA mismatch repair protein MutS [Chloroflexi bacterium]|nr:DNA mismatch repair protein MutS [Chloroflexota bacterium]